MPSHNCMCNAIPQVHVQCHATTACAIPSHNCMCNSPRTQWLQLVAAGALQSTFQPAARASLSHFLSFKSCRLKVDDRLRQEKSPQPSPLLFFQSIASVRPTHLCFVVETFLTLVNFPPDFFCKRPSSLFRQHLQQAQQQLLAST